MSVALPRRDEVAPEHTWDLSLVFADSAAWEAELSAIDTLAQQFTTLEGTLSQGAAQLLAALRMRDEIGQRLWALYTYAHQLKDSDSTNPTGQALNDRAGSFAARISAALAFVEPEILAIPEATLSGWIASEPGLQIYAYELNKLNQQRAHIRSAEVESILAQFGDITRAPYEIFGMLNDSDIVFPNINDEQGATLQLSHARYGRFLESDNRRVRHDAFKGMYSAYKPFRNTLATTLSTAVRSHVLEARLRNYSSALEAALKPNEIPLEVYHNLISTIEANLPKLHRYMAIRKKLMDLNELRMYDLYTSPVPEVPMEIPYAEAQDLMLAAFAPLGSDYAEALRESFGSRWIDVYENVGKRSGAYSGGSYGTPPYILLNYQDRLNDVFTLAHELGHSMHSFFTRKTQPFVYGNYTIFVAEVASTLNETLLTHYLLNHRDDEQLRKRLLVTQLEDVRTTIFRQTMFASFELDMHTRIEAGESLTTEGLCQRYYDLVAAYHGPAVTLDEEISWEWARIPHFYYNYYVYQYATGLSAALALSRQIINEGQPAIERYLRFLSSGSSKSSIDLLRAAGVDMTTTAPVQAAMDAFDGLLDQLEALV
ncbi:oligoendopeptidase F [Oscillochloris trichoides DG-6]|uniref:Oligopeptidase F n=1 Tax=Oscillochloris trichoides DG-6 TaxID=765420 RepID=E1IHR2_9CHLR|nr:oligoendopeptidase F [Oscillochloris trichoides]EFO79282.1 oligoendopeptidase F [Oscillochloris trichoides DG-6]